MLLVDTNLKRQTDAHFVHLTMAVENKSPSFNVGMMPVNYVRRRKQLYRVLRSEGNLICKEGQEGDYILLCAP